MTLEEYEQELADLTDSFENQLSTLQIKHDENVNAIEDKYIQANRKYPDGYVLASGRTIQSAFVKEDKICYRINPNLTVYEEDL